MNPKLTLALAAFLVFGSALQAQPEAPKSAMCKEMMDQKAKLTADATAQDAKLTGQIAAMNRATKDRKLALLAEIVTTMAEQRIAMDARKAGMEATMMNHMADCSMMKGMSEHSVPPKP